MESSQQSSYTEGGLYQKFQVSRTDGKALPAGAEYYVLNPVHDPHARVALDFYARSVEEENPALAADVLNGLNRVEAGEKFYQK